MKMKNIIYSAFLLLFICQAHAQKASLAAADKKYDRFSYIDAIATYERIASKGYKDEKMFQKLGNAYYFNSELVKAEKWYTELFTMNPNQDGETCYRYSQCLKAIGNYKKADAILEVYSKISGTDQRAKLFNNDKNYLQEIKEKPVKFNIEDSGINSVSSDYGSAFLGNKIIFASARDTIGISKKVFKQTNEYFTNLYSSEVTPKGKLSKPERFGNKINSKFHESTPVFTKDGKTMYLTRNNFLDSKKGKDSLGITLLKIYKATLEDGKWVNLTELPFNSDEYSVAHPALSPDDKELYFASNMPGTIGQSDIFKVKINDDGTYSKPENLGTAINTEGKESFPFISDDNQLYFASDGRPGLGGLDIYSAKLSDDNKFGEVENLGEPINSKQDDFAFLIDNKNKIGFFSSNRAGGKGSDDIYSFSEIVKVKCIQKLEGIITDLDSKEVLANAKVSLFDTNNQIITTAFTDNNGAYNFDVDCGKTYFVRAEIKHYETNEEQVSIDNVSGKTTLSISLVKNGCELAVGLDVAKCFGIKFIYFDLNKSDIRNDAVLDLEKILDVMKQYPTIKVEVRSHTDCRQTAKYNLLLSDRRAKATINWLVENGIDASRLTGKGYGESQLINDCGCEPTNDSNCTEEQHQANRRSEFIIMSL
jgi:outer membrane protein OmpA-like peptidoglycan-associated protein/tetratricopeptide (TPR) repeat protein